MALNFQALIEGYRKKLSQGLNTLSKTPLPQPIQNVVNQPIVNKFLTAAPNLINQYGSGYTQTGTYGLVNAGIREPQTLPEKTLRTIGQVSGFLNPVTSKVGGKIFGGLNTVGSLPVKLATQRFAPQATGFVARKVLPAVGGELAQTLGYAGVKKASEMAGLSEKRPLNAQTLAQDFAFGLGARGAFNVPGLARQFMGDKKFSIKYGNKILKDLTADEAAGWMKYLDMTKTKYKLQQTADVEGNALPTMGIKGKPSVQGSLPKDIKRDYPDSVKNPLYEEMRNAQSKLTEKIQSLQGKYKTDAEIPKPIRAELNNLKADWQNKANQWEQVYVKSPQVPQGSLSDISAPLKYETSISEIAKKHNIAPDRIKKVELNISELTPEVIGEVKTQKPLSGGALEVVIDKNGKYIVADGNHRLAQAKSEGYKTIPAYVIDESLSSLPQQPVSGSVAQLPKGEVPPPSVKEPLPWETPEYLKANPPEQLKTDIESVQQSEAKGVLGVLDDVKRSFADWVNARRATKVEALLKKKEFADLDSEGMRGIFRFQAGDQSGRFKDVKSYFDSKYKQVKDTGIDVHYKKNYLPQLWLNTQEEIEAALGRKLGTKPSFSLQSIIKDYQTGIEAGLTPKFKTISDLTSWYEKTANKAIADKNFFSYLAKDGSILTPSKAPRDWVTLDPDSFPKIRVQTDEGLYNGVYKAPPELASMINNYLRRPQFEALDKIAGYVSRAKNITLSFGIPRTAINAHGVNILARHTLFGTGGNPISRFLTGVKYMLNPKSAETFLNQNLQNAPRAVKAGLTLSTEEHTALLNEAETVAKTLGKEWNKAFEIPLFNKMIPSLKLSSFENLVKNGMNEKDAAKLINNVYGGINWEQMGRSRDLQNLIRSIILAPDWAESGLKTGGNIVKSVFTKGDVASRYRAMGATFVGSYIAANIVNKLTSGHYMYENDPGHTFEIEAGYTSDGQKRHIKPYGTAVDFFRLPYDAALGLAKGDPGPTFRAISNRLSIPLSSAMHLLTNVDYKGSPIYGRDRYGNPLPPIQSAGGIASEALGFVGFPSFAKNAIDVATGKQGIEQGVLQALELPFRYSGGAYSKTQKELAAGSDLRGKQLYDFNKKTQGQSPLSDRQMAIYKEAGPEYLDTLYETRKIKSDTKKQIEAFKNPQPETKPSFMRNLKNMISPAGAAELTNQSIQSDVQMEAQLELAKAKVDYYGETQKVGPYIIFKQDGKVKTIDTSFQPTPPEKTGNEDLDKEAISRFKSDISKKENDLYDLYKAGQININEYNSQMAPLKQAKASYKKPKKFTFKKVSMRKVTPTTVKKISIPAPRYRKIKNYTITAKTVTKPKITTTKLSKWEPKAETKYTRVKTSASLT